MTHDPIDAAYHLLRKSVIYYRDAPVGTLAAHAPHMSAPNYRECFVRDFVPCGLVQLADGEYALVRNFLRTVLELREQERQMEGHEIQAGVMPASFRVHTDDGEERLLADFGDRAIGRVAPVDSMMWWTLLLYAYTRASGSRELAEDAGFQAMLGMILTLCLRGSFEVYPTLLVPDAAFMIDRRLGVYGHPLEIQALFYGTLRAAAELLVDNDANHAMLVRARQREQTLRSYVRMYYWLDLARLNDIHRYHTEQFGSDSVNALNIFPESIPDWVADWMPSAGGYLVGNLGPGRIDCRFFGQGNLLAVILGLATDAQAGGLMELYAARWDDLIGAMPAKIAYPAMTGVEWEVLTGSDRKNEPWSYHNGGNWPALLWGFVAAALKAGRGDLARRAYDQAAQRLPADDWPEYYDGRSGRLIGRRANLRQIWSAAALILARRLLDRPALLALLPDGAPGAAPAAQ